MGRSTGAEERELGEARRSGDLPEEESVPPPIGTTFVLSLYFVLLIVMWLAMFFGLLGRR